MSRQTQISSAPFRPAGEAYAFVSRLEGRLTGGAGSVVKALVIGAGKSGMAAARLLVRKGADVIVADDRAEARERATTQGFEVADLTAEAVHAAELVVLSPGVPRVRPELASAVRLGKLIGEVELASWFIDVPILGITGTNGKSTTTSLVAAILEEAWPDRVFAGGNLGRPLSELALAPGEADVAVVELSSYQLESIVQAKFRVACWLNLTPDHTDRYDDLAKYAGAKRRLIERRAVDGVAVLNAKDRWCAHAGLALGGPVRWFATSPTSDLAGHSGTRLDEQGEAVRVTARGEERYRLDNAALIGTHNKGNALAAIECARAMRVAPEQVQAGLLSFRGLAHRLEWVAEESGVEWRNDSKATNVESVVTALEALDRPVRLIAGGRDKGASWEPLVRAAKGRVVQVYAIGEAEGLVVSAFAGSGVEVVRSGTLEAAVKGAKEAAGAGDVVLLAPACASFDQFPNFEVRGDRFKSLVLELVGVQR